MDIRSFDTRYCLGEATLLSLSIQGCRIELDAELIAGNQPPSGPLAGKDAFIPVRIAIETCSPPRFNMPFSGFSPDQDGEVSRLGPIACRNGAAWHELAFFLHDHSWPVGNHDMIVIEFPLKDIGLTALA